VGDDFSITEETLQDVHVVAVAGELDRFTAHQLNLTLERAIRIGRTHLVIDLTATTFFDSTAYAVLVGASQRARSYDGWLALVLPDASARQRFEMAGLDQLFPIYDTRDEALGATPPPMPRTREVTNGRDTDR